MAGIPEIVYARDGDVNLAYQVVGALLESIQAPTLVLHRRGDRYVKDGHAQYLAKRIPQARLVDIDGDDHEWFAGDSGRLLDEIESFLTGGRGAMVTNRVLSTVLFTDIVGSTERATVLGDDAWTGALGAHNRVIERHVTGSRGRVVKFTGDGALATFDGPARAINCARDSRRGGRHGSAHPRRFAHRRGGDCR